MGLGERFEPPKSPRARESKQLGGSVHRALGRRSCPQRQPSSCPQSLSSSCPQSLPRDRRPPAPLGRQPSPRRVQAIQG